MGIGTDIDCNLTYANRCHASTWLGIQFQFPRGENNESDGFGQCHTHCSTSEDVVPTNTAIITAKFPPDTEFEAEKVPELSSSRFPESSYYTLRVALKQGSNLTVDGFGLPFSNPGHPSEGWLNENKPVDDITTLSQLFKRRSFRLIVQVPNTFGDLSSYLKQSRHSRFEYPYGHNHSWSAQRYLTNMVRWRGQQFLPAWSFENDNDHIAVLTQSVVQDMLWAASDAAEIFAIKLQAYFVPVPEENIAYAIVSCGSLFTDKYKSAITRLTNRTFDIQMSFHEDETPIDIPPLDEALRWPRYAKAAWTCDARIIYRHQIPELKKHAVKKSDIVLRLNSQRSKDLQHSHYNQAYNRSNSCPAWKTYDSRPEADAAYRNGEGSWNTVSLLMDPHVEDSIRKVDAVCDFYPDSDEMYRPDFMCQLHRDLLRGNGFFNTLNPPDRVRDDSLCDTSDDDLSGQLQALEFSKSLASSQSEPLTIPVINLFQLSPDYQDALTAEIYVADRSRFINYMKNRPLGLGIMVAGPGLGKTTAMAVGALGMAETLGPVYACAATHVAIDNFAARLDIIDRRVVRRFNDANPDKPRLRQKLIIRGFKIEDEITAFRSFLENPKMIDKTYDSPHAVESDLKWHLELSLTYYLLMALGSSAVRELNPIEDSHKLIKFCNEVSQKQSISALRQLVAGELSKEERKSALRNLEPTRHNRVLEDLFVSLLNHAEIVCTTPSLSARKHFVEWRRKNARAIVVDEAGNISRPDLYTVWGNNLLPCLIGGDDRQLLPAVMTEHLKESEKGNKFFNRHPADGKISPLAFFKMNGWPVFRLHTQFRMAKGLFDLCQQTIYPDVPLEYGPGSEISLPQHKGGRDLEHFMQQKFPSLSKPPASKLLPIFIHCEGSRSKDDDITASRVNKDQILEALDFIHEFVTQTQTDPAKIAMIAPYKANARLAERLRRKFGKYHGLSRMSAASTVDSFQGKERDIVVVVMGTTKESGPGFTRDKHRLNVMFSRQKSGLVVFGDYHVVEFRRRSLWSDDKHDESDVLGSMYDYFEKCGRLVNVKVNSKQ